VSAHETTLPVESRLPGFDGARGWLNSQPLTPAGLRGKVVLVDFWTYTCINWLRTLAYVRAWSQRYRLHGFVVVGVHTPEFPFERDEDNVRRAVAAMDVTYPVALDSDFAVWQAFSNHYWPAVYIADAEGRIRYHHFGEEAYEETERVIQRLLREAGRDESGDDLVSIVPDGVEANADWAHLGSPETYLGFQQGINLVASNVNIGTPGTFVIPDALPLNGWALGGEWTIDDRAAVLNRPHGLIAFRFRARDVNLVLRSREGSPVAFRVLVDGAAPGPAHGLDVDAAGGGVLVEPRLYQLIRQPGAIADQTFEIAFAAAGVEAYVFTFGWIAGLDRSRLTLRRRHWKQSDPSRRPPTRLPRPHFQEKGDHSDRE
jgi:thiol-disulfide isomerase/thioredoxin